MNTGYTMFSEPAWGYTSKVEAPLYSKLGSPFVPPSVENKPKYKQEIIEQVIESSDEVLSVETFVENDELVCGSVHKMWGLVELSSKTISPKLSKNTLSFDFVVIVDESESMMNDQKLAYVQGTIEYLLAKLGKEHRLCLLKFNQKVTSLTMGLQDLTQETKKSILNNLKQIHPSGSTNISEALFSGLKVLRDRPSNEHNRLSFVFLFTDGIANEGLRGTSFMDALNGNGVPKGCTVHTFGYGSEHDSKTLQKISLNSQGGVYHFIDSAENIPPTFGECLGGILSTTAYNVDVRVQGLDGCRLVQFYTMYGLKEYQEVKDYSVSFGSLSTEETRGLLFKLSLRKFDAPTKQSLAKVVVTYTNAFTGLDCKKETIISINRPKAEVLKPIPVELDLHINRFTAASAIETAIEKSNMKQFDAAQKHLEQVIETSRNSVSFKSSQTGQYIEDLIADLSLCKCSLGNYEMFTEKGNHIAYAFSTMYFMERSNGTRNLLGLKSSLLSKRKDYSDSKSSNSCKRGNCYGYVSFFQEHERTEASKEVSTYMTRYADGAVLKE